MKQRRAECAAGGELERTDRLDMVYVSNGNIPSRWAHTLQTMKMSAAFANRLNSFQLLIATDWLGLLHRKRSIYAWYGIPHPFPIRRLPVAVRCKSGELERSNVKPFADRARQYLRRARPALVYTRNHRSALNALEDGFQVIFETHDGPGHPFTMRYMEEFSRFQNLRGVVTTSPLLQDAFSSVGIAKDRILVLPNAVDLNRFAGDSVDRLTARARLGLAPSEPLVVYIGSLAEYKGIGTLIGAARSLQSVRFLIVGGERGEIAGWHARVKVPANVRFEPFVENRAVPLRLAAADVCAVPNSRSDRTSGWTYSLKLYEYLAARRPVVVSDIPSLRSVITDGETGLIVPPDEPAALGRAIERLIADEALAARLAAAGYDLVSRQSWDSRAAAILEALAPDLLRRSGTC